jgi:hypothetical protein
MGFPKISSVVYLPKTYKHHTISNLKTVLPVTQKNRKSALRLYINQINLEDHSPQGEKDDICRAFLWP